jgi:hypothetical protein
MNTLVAGNSHIVGFREACETVGATFTYVPVPLCKNFEEVVLSGSGRFELDAGWKNMSSPIGSKRINLWYDFSQSSKKLIFVGMKLFGCYPRFGPLIFEKNKRPFLLCLGNDNFNIPKHNKYLLISKSCLKQIFFSELVTGVANYSWLFQKFDKVYWVPSPPPSHQFAEIKFLREHKWLIKSGLHARYLSIFNECLDQVNKSDVARSAGVTFLRHPGDCIDPQTGFLLPEFSFDRNLADIHASGKYYEQFTCKFNARNEGLENSLSLCKS